MKVNDYPALMPPNRNGATPEASQHSASDQIATKKRKDAVSLSKTAEALTNAARQVKAMPGVDLDRVARVKARLQKGTYRVDAEKAASNMLAESLLKDH